VGAGPADASTTDAVRRWQADVASTVNELSGGSKAHWLSKSFSAAFLIASPAGGDGALVVEAPTSLIVERLLDVIAQARTSLTQVAAGIASVEPPPPRRFEFVHDDALRRVLEQAFVEGERALDAGDAETALKTFCSALEAIITDALRVDVSGMSFDQRIAAAETAGLIRGGCARLPPSARHYRDETHTGHAAGLREAQLVRQVLRVVMRDLDPGR
jgi:hypothetical protein